MWVVDALTRANSTDPSTVRDALEAIDTFEGLIGTLIMDSAIHNPAMGLSAVYQQATDLIFTGKYRMSQRLKGREKRYGGEQ